MRQLLFSLSVLAACAGKAPNNSDPMPDAGSAEPDGPVVVDEGVRVSGKAMDYFTNLALADATVVTDGIDPQKMATTVSDGTYTLDGIPFASSIYMSVTRANYRGTRNVATSVADMPVQQDVYIMSIADVARQYTSGGDTPTLGKAFLAGEMKNAAGAPLEGIPLANVTLVDMADVPVPGIKGPFFFGANGDIDRALTTATAYGGRSRVAILDVPPGTFKLKVTYTGPAGDVIDTTMVTAAADGATLAATGGVVMGGGNLDPKFETDVYPRLQKAANGGLGCANCHTAGGAGAILIYDEPAAMVLANLKAAPGVIDLATPANSLLLTKPLYEPPPELQNHPNATFLDTNDPDYKMILLWITNGTKP